MDNHIAEAFKRGRECAKNWIEYSRYYGKKDARTIFWVIPRYDKKTEDWQLWKRGFKIELC